ncbi:MAG: ATP-binding protein [Nitrospinota bacterium]|nr:ATP-binding protein [Nitrospinota bacterium]
MYSSNFTYDTEEEILTRRRKNVLRAVLGLIGISVILLTGWIYFKELDPGTPLLNNVVVFSLINLNIILLMVLIVLVVRNLVHLYSSARSPSGRGRLQLRLILAFVMIALLPTLGLFIVASGLIDKSFNTFFNPKVENALKGSFDVANEYYRASEGMLLLKGRELGEEIESHSWSTPESFSYFKQFLNSKIELIDASSASLYDKSRKMIVSVRRKETLSVGDDKNKIQQILPPDFDFIDKVLEGKSMSTLENSEDGDIVYAVVPIKGTSGVVGYLVVSKLISKRLVAKVEGLMKAYDQFFELKLSKNPIKASYIITFLLVSLLILFSAIWFGFHFARGITVPIEKLAEGTLAVSEGDLGYRVETKAEGEIGTLVEAFNRMTKELQTNKKEIEEKTENLTKSNLEIDRRRVYMEAMLDNVRTGVISVNRRGQVTILNQFASEILNIIPKEVIGKHFNEIFKNEYLELIRSLIRSSDSVNNLNFSKQIELLIDGQMLVFYASLTFLKSKDGSRLGTVLVFDDLTDLIRTQKVAAWREVAQGIAHEIKNPLTPIQLSAQRMRAKYNQNTSDFPQILEICTDTIVNQVKVLMEMIDEFSSFARMPEPRLRLCKTDELIHNVISLYRDRREDIKIKSNIPNSLPSLMADPEQVQRVFINLLENAFESMKNGGEIQFNVSSDNEKEKLIFEIKDEGKGILAKEKEHIFSPYFTTKASGSGLGLAICHRIISDHNGMISVKDNHPIGSTFEIQLPSKKDFLPAGNSERFINVG